jgi:hypothetical protein
MKFAKILKNTGNLPAENTIAKQHVYYGDEEIPSTDGEDHPSRVLPGTEFEYSGEVGALYYPDVVSGNKKLYIETALSYEWQGGSEKRCYETWYSPEMRTMREFGECVSWTHTPGEIHSPK